MTQMKAKCEGHELCECCIHCGADRPAEVLVCDKCGEEPGGFTPRLYEYDGMELCRECLLETVPSITM